MHWDQNKNFNLKKAEDAVPATVLSHVESMGKEPQNSFKYFKCHFALFFFLHEVNQSLLISALQWFAFSIAT